MFLVLVCIPSLTTLPQTTPHTIFPPLVSWKGYGPCHLSELWIETGEAACAVAFGQRVSLLPLSASPFFLYGAHVPKDDLQKRVILQGAVPEVPD